jgi:CRISPR-associated protein Csc3
MISPTKAALYMKLFAYVAPKGDDWMTHARTLTDLYRQFYRAKRRNSNAILRPLTVAANALLNAHPAYEAELVDIVRGELYGFMDRVGDNRADGYFPKGSTQEGREQAIIAFSEYLVYQLYRDAFGGDRAALRGKQLNLLKNACEVIYLDEQRREWQTKGMPDDEALEGDISDELTSESA